MNREILFRGMCPFLKKFYQGNLTVLNKKVDSIDPGVYISNSVGMPFAYKVTPETVGQYTGLTDKEQNRIFEGDIVDLQSNLDSDSGRGVVVYFSDGFRVNLGNNQEEGDFSILWWAKKRDENGIWDKKTINCAVIGNIHDNPDLLNRHMSITE